MQGRFQDPPGQRLDQARLLGERDELGRRHQTPLRMLPTHEGLDAGQRPVAQADEGLVVEKKLLLLDGEAELSHHGQLAGAVLFILGRIADNHTARALGHEEGNFGAPQ